MMFIIKFFEERIPCRKNYSEETIKQLKIGDEITIIGNIGSIHEYKTWKCGDLRYCEIISVNGKPF